MKNWFDSEEEALRYKETHQLTQRVPEYSPGRNQWALNFPLKASVTVLQPHAPTASVSRM